ncbi:MAG: hydrogenobyrinic acid a,c-diamide synthase (glutamine-hydrolyzing) [Deltaproteobacteria bacterium]|nr:hydrogenobyrinic acid a,c-diamide synthase (glutamine-hydrolyzing) [Deltaproteobacteria bacterium]
MLNSPSRIIIAALKGGSGKTILSLGLTASWRKKGRRVASFKKGPDFIDSGWLAFAAGRPCYNLDPFMMSESQITRSFLSNSSESDISLIEGSRGLFDGLDLEGCCSTAELGKMIKAPVLIIVDVTMATRTIAALIVGCQRFDPDLNIAAVILNRVAGTRHETVIRDSIERYCGIPVVGSIPKLKENLFPERHMGLVPYQERDHAEKAIQWTRRIVEENLDLDAIWRLANGVEHLSELDAHQEELPAVSGTDTPRIGFIRDSSFWFYYPENLDQLKGLGAILVEVNSMTDRELPDLDGLYIGGGFPETQAKALADNKSFRDSLKQKIEEGLPVYAECGGLIYMGEALIVNGRTYPMVGALPIRFMMGEKPQGHGYTILEVDRENPYFPEGEVLKGHEFHYSRPLINPSEKIDPVFKVRRGRGLDGQGDGLCKNNLLATYTHIHARGYRLWGENFFKKTLNFREFRMKISQNDDNRD